ncbi:hypothetical protein Y032_0162g3398 [Ancylostoma ceylanicum]|uniref:Uncharacterized protein n=1 Tax=Ancylostoma ceylanicum TaxID=53326 RepID=A0A016SWU9_9BILA|nr:hypothetical protein Y032_0162g3398 [Ancylostoma ceylanicum]
MSSYPIDHGTFGDAYLYEFVSFGHALVSPSCKHGSRGEMVEWVKHRSIRQKIEVLDPASGIGIEWFKNGTKKDPIKKGTTLQKHQVETFPI